jgi:general stress protein 26
MSSNENFEKVTDSQETENLQTDSSKNVGTNADMPLTSEEKSSLLQQDRMAAIGRVKKIMDKTRVAFLATLSGKQLVSRPMYVQSKEFDGTLWFYTKIDSHKVDEIKKDSRVNVIFSGKSYVSLTGRAEIVENDLKEKMYWGKTAAKFFKTGYDDPQIVLIKIEALSAEFWESTGFWSSLFKSIVPLSKDISQTVEF